MQRGAYDCALSFVVPLDATGLKFLRRGSESVPGADPFDKPLSTRFDEQGAFCIFGDPELRVLIEEMGHGV
jgi:4-hydroxyphenylacetate 3-monooxygenase